MRSLASQAVHGPGKPAAHAAHGPTVQLAASATAATVAGPSPPNPALVNMRCLDGLRAASCLAIMLFHCWQGMWQLLLPFEVTAPLTRGHWFVR